MVLTSLYLFKGDTCLTSTATAVISLSVRPVTTHQSRARVGTTTYYNLFTDPEMGSDTPKATMNSVDAGG